MIHSLEGFQPVSLQEIAAPICGRCDTRRAYQILFLAKPYHNRRIDTKLQICPECLEEIKPELKDTWKVLSKT